MHPTFFAFIHTVASRFLVLLIMIVLFVPTLIFLLLPERARESRGYYWLARCFYTSLSWALLVPIEVTGRENITNNPSIIIANHQSSVDIPLVGRMVGTFPHFWLATNELLGSPIWRFVLPRVTVIVDVSTPMRAMRTLVSAVERAERTHGHVILFPEGGRFSDGKIHDFYSGFVILARKTGRPVVPIKISGANELYPRGAFFAQWRRLKVVVGTPFVIGEHETDDEFKNRVQAWFTEQI